MAGKDWKKTEGSLFLYGKDFLISATQTRNQETSTRNGILLGANWVSITHSLTKYIIEQKNLIKKLFEKTLCCDEFFVQTLVWNSKYRENVYSFEEDYFACLRLIDWKRGNPYVWRNQDYEELMNAPHLFARKFDENIDQEVIDKIFQTISSRQKAGKENS